MVDFLHFLKNTSYPGRGILRVFLGLFPEFGAFLVGRLVYLVNAAFRVRIDPVDYFFNIVHKIIP